MSKLGKKVLLYRTNESGKTPSVDSVEYGELALNYNSETPFIAFQDNENNIQKIGVLSSETGTSEYHTMTQKAITETIANATSDSNGVYIIEYSKLVDKTTWTFEEYTNLKNAILNKKLILIELIEANGATYSYASIKSGFDGSSGPVNEWFSLSFSYNDGRAYNSDVYSYGDKYQTQFETYQIVHLTRYVNGSWVEDDYVTVYLINDVALDNSGDGTKFLSNDGSYKEMTRTEIFEYTSQTTAEAGTFTKLKTAIQSAKTIIVKTDDGSYPADADIANDSTSEEICLKYFGFDVCEQRCIFIADDESIRSQRFNLAEKDSIPTKTSELTNDSKFITIDDVEHKLSDTYTSAVYPSDTGDAVFTPASASSTLDEAIYTVDSNVATLVQEVLNNEKTVAAAITAHNDAAGFSENGKYVVNTAATYINAATSLSEADTLLDSAIGSASSSLTEANTTIATLQTKIIELETVLARVISAVGLNTTSGESYGTFVVPTTAQTSGYTTAATSVMNAITIMDNQVEENETVTAYALSDLNTRVDENTTSITDLTSRVSTNETNISNLDTRVTNVESELNGINTLADTLVDDSE